MAFCMALSHATARPGVPHAGQPKGVFSPSGASQGTSISMRAASSGGCEDYRGDDLIATPCTDHLGTCACVDLDA
jgi:hypothetical protein